MTATKPKPVKRVAPPTACVAGNHVFMVTNWKIGGGQEKAVHVRCRACLMPLDLEEMEAIEWGKANL